MKKLIAVLLLISTLVLSLAGCGSDNNTGNGKTETPKGDGTGEDRFTGVDFGGASTTIAYQKNSKYLNCLDTDGNLITDDTIVAAVKQRNDYVQGKLNLVVDYYILPTGASGNTGTRDKFLALYNANDDFADAMGYNLEQMVQLMMLGIFRNALDDTRENYFDFNDGTWMKEAMISISLEEDLDSKVFLVANDYFLNIICMIEVLFVNETRLIDVMGGDEDAIDTFQKAVLDGEWTYDTMSQLSKRAYANTGTDSSKIDKDDQLGTVMRNNASTLTYSSSTKYIEKTSDGYKYISNILPLSRLTDKAMALFNGSGTYQATDEQDAIDTFSKGKSLFFVGGLLRDLEKEYFSHLKCATIPYPKVSLEDEYSTLVSTSAVVGAIFKTGDFTPVSAFWQYSGLKSEYAKIKYYEDGLGLKYETGTNTQMMLNLLYDTAVFNRSFYWDLYISRTTTGASMASTCLSSSLADNQNKVVSMWEGVISMKNQSIADAYKTWKSL